MTRYPRLIGVELSDAERSTAIKDFCELYFGAQDCGLDPVVEHELQPAGDLFVLRLDDWDEDE